MGIPLAALAINQNQPGPLDMATKALQLKSLAQNQQYQAQAQPLELQQRQQQVQQQSMQLADQKAMTDALNNWDGKDIEELPGMVLKHGGSAQAVFGLKNQIIEQRKNLATADEATLKNEGTKNDIIAGHIEAMKGAPDKQDAYQKMVADLQQKGLTKPGQMPPQYPGDDQLNLLEKGMIGQKQLVEQAQKERETKAKESEAATRAVTAQTGAKKLEAEMNPQSSLYAPSAASVAMGTAPGAKQIQAGEARLAGQKSAAEAAARQPFEIALKKATQAIQDGDPEAAGKLLVQGDVAPSQIISARKPEFAQKAFDAAHRLSGGTWNGQKAEADFKVASSPAQVAFFGSAKSLTDPGGTLDQLKEAGKDIPQDKIPIFNSVADAIKASTGSGPIAKYAAISLGVADDYAKVMGGGTGSDTSRTQALQIISAKQSPEQRAASIEGIRGAVGSQTKSRIGDNAVLGRMYGGNSAPSAGGNAPAAQAQHVAGGASQGLQEGHTGTGSDGKKYVVKGGKWVPAQ